MADEPPTHRNNPPLSELIAYALRTRPCGSDINPQLWRVITESEFVATRDAGQRGGSRKIMLWQKRERILAHNPLHEDRMDDSTSADSTLYLSSTQDAATALDENELERELESLANALEMRHESLTTSSTTTTLFPNLGRAYDGHK